MNDDLVIQDLKDAVRVHQTQGVSLVTKMSEIDIRGGTPEKREKFRQLRDEAIRLIGESETSIDAFVSNLKNVDPGI